MVPPSDRERAIAEQQDFLLGHVDIGDHDRHERAIGGLALDPAEEPIQRSADRELGKAGEAMEPLGRGISAYEGRQTSCVGAIGIHRERRAWPERQKGIGVAEGGQLTQGCDK